MKILFKNIKKIVFIVTAILLIVFLVHYYIKSTNAMKNTFVILGTVEKKKPLRGYCEIEFSFIYRKKIMHNSFSANIDTFNIGQKVLVKVSREYPSEFSSLVSK